MLVNMLIRLSTLSLGLSYVVCTTPQQQAQLATLHDRMNQILSTLYDFSPILSKIKTTTLSEETSTPAQESPCSIAAPPPKVVYVSPPSSLEAGAQPVEYGYPSTTNPVPRSAWPFAIDYNYQPQYAPPVYSPPLPRQPYPEYARAAYPQLPAPQPAPIPPPFPSPVSYGPFSPAQYPASFLLSLSQPRYPVAPSLPNPYPLQAPYPPPSSFPYIPSYPLSLPYRLSALAPYPSPMPPQYAPLPYPSPVPAPFPPLNSVPYPPSFLYSQPMFPSAYPKLSEIMPQPQ